MAVKGLTRENFSSKFSALTAVFALLSILLNLPEARAFEGGLTEARCLASAFQIAETAREPEVVIAGMGMAGAALARRLNQIGYADFKVYDSRSAEDLPGGCGFILQANGIHALDRLGVLEAAKKKGNWVTSYAGFDKNGLSTGSHEMESPLLGLKRSVLLKLLLEQLPQDHLHFKSKIDRVEPSATRKILIASDGVGSKIRQQLHPEIEFQDPGYFEVVGLADNPELAKSWDGSFRRYEDKSGRMVFGVFPAGDGQLVWYFRKSKADMPDASVKIDLNWVLSHVSNWSKDVTEVISSTGNGSFGVWKPTTLTSLPEPYSHQGVFLLGDAAHPVLTFTSQGVSSALEDAVDLAELFSKGIPSQQSLRSLSNRIRERSQKYIEGGKAALDHYFSGDSNDANSWRTAPK